MPTAGYLRARLSRLGGTLALEGEKLRLALPGGRLSPELRRALEIHRDALIADLAAGADPLADPHPGRPPGPPPGTAPSLPPKSSVLTPFQHSFWTMHKREDADLATLHASLILPIGGVPDGARMAQAVGLLAQRHDMLRLRVATGATGAPLQWLDSAPALSIAPDGAEGDLRIAELTSRRFDLAAEPPLRLLLLQGREASRLVLVGHHVALDGWSVGLLLRDLFAFYEQGAGATLPPIPLDPLTLSTRIAGHVAAPATQARMRAHIRELAGLPLCRSLPTDFPRGRPATAQGCEITFDLPPQTVSRLSAIARQAGGGLYSALLAACQLTLATLTGHPRLPVMLPVANRALSPMLEPVVTCLANGALLAPHLPADLPYREGVARVADIMADALDRQDLPYDDVVNRLDQPRLPGVFPGAQIYVALQDAAALPRVQGLTLHPACLPEAPGRQDLLIEFRHLPDRGLGCRVNYDTRLYRPVTAATLADTLQAVLTGAAEAPDQPVRLPVTTAMPILPRPMRIACPDPDIAAQLRRLGHDVAEQTGVTLNRPDSAPSLLTLADTGQGPATVLGLLEKAQGDSRFAPLSALCAGLSLRSPAGAPIPPELPGLLYLGERCLDLLARQTASGALELLVDFSTAAAGWAEGRFLQLGPLAHQLRGSGLVADAAMSLRRIGGRWRPVLWVVPRDASPLADLSDRLHSAIGEQHPPGLLVSRLSALPRDCDGRLDRHWLATLPVNDPAILDVLAEGGLAETDAMARPEPARDVMAHATDYLPPTASGCSSFPAILPSVAAALDRDPGRGAEAVHHGPALPLAWPQGGWSPCAWLDHPGTLTVIEHDGTTLRRPLTEVLSRALRIAAALRYAGLGPGDSVVLAPRRVEHYLTAFFGATAAGLRVALMAPTASFAANGTRSGPQASTQAATALTHIGRIAGSRTVIADAGALEGDLVPGFTFLPCQHLLEHPPLAAPHGWQADDTVLLGFTSGSTGLPKGVPLRASNIWSMPQAFGPSFGLAPASHALCFTGLDHVASLIGFCGSALSAGASLTLFATERFIAVPETLPRCLSELRVTHGWAPDFAWKLVAAALEAEEGGLDLQHLQQIFSGGECPLRATFARLAGALARHGGRPALRTAWGMAETTSIFTLSAPFRAEDDSHAEHAGVLDSGIPLPGQSLRVVGANGQPVRGRRSGRLQVQGPSVFREYILAERDGTQARQSPLTPDGWLETGDLAYLSRGRLMLLGREKDVIVLNGRNISQAAIEDGIDAVKGVRAGFSTAIAAREGRRGRQLLVVFFCPESENPEDATLITLIEDVAQVVAVAYGTRPDFILPVTPEDVPKTSLGKIQRERLRRAFETGAHEPIAARIDDLRGNGRQIPARLWCWQNSGVEAGADMPERLVLRGGDAARRLTEALRAQGVDAAEASDAAPGDLLVDASALDLAEPPDSNAIVAEAIRRRDLMLRQSTGRIVWLEPPAFAAAGQALAAMAGQELAGLQCTSIMVEPGAIDALSHSPTLSATGLCAPALGDRGLQIGPDGQVIRHILAPVHPVAPAAWRDLPADATILVPGGLGRVGRLVLPVLLDWTGWRFVLLGRTAPDSVQDRHAALVRGLTEAHRLTYVQADPTDAMAVLSIAREHGAAAAINLAGSPARTDLASTAKAALHALIDERLACAEALDGALRDTAQPGADPVVVHVTSTYALLGRRDHLGYSLAHGAHGDWIAARQRNADPQAPRHVELACGQWQAPDGSCDARTELAARQGFGLIDAIAGATGIIRAMLGPESRLVLGLDPEGIETRALIRQSPRPLDRLELSRATAAGMSAADALAAEAGTRLHRAGPDAAPASAARLTGLEAGIMALWQRVLGSGRQFDPDANFFDVGGSSLLAARLHHQMNQSFGGPQTLVSLFSHTTIRAQARLLSRDGDDPQPEISPARTRRSVASIASRRRATRAPEP